MSFTAGEDRKFVIFDSHLFILFSSCKLIVVGLIIFFFVHFDAYHSENLWNRIYSGNFILHSFYLPFSNWDGQHYLLLATKGYGTLGPSHAFFPLFPILIRLVNYVISDVYIATFFVNLVLSYFFLVFFYNYAMDFCSRYSALRSVLFVLAYPSAFFMTVFYSEALFLFLLFGFLYFYSRKKYWSLAFLVLLPLSRGQALFICVALVADQIWKYMRHRTTPGLYEISNLAVMLLGFTMYFGFIYITTGAALSGIEAQNIFVFGNSLINTINLFHFMNYLITPYTYIFDYNNGLIDKLFIILLLISIPLVIKKNKDTLFICLYSCLAYFPASMGNGGSYLRHSLIAIPFLSITIFSQFPRSSGIIDLFTAILALFQVLLIMIFALNSWVA